VRTMACTCATKPDVVNWHQETSHTYCEGAGKPMAHFVPEASYLWVP
jgi:hypothetical protein